MGDCGGSFVPFVLVLFTAVRVCLFFKRGVRMLLAEEGKGSCLRSFIARVRPVRFASYETSVRYSLALLWHGYVVGGWCVLFLLDTKSGPGPMDGHALFVKAPKSEAAAVPCLCRR